MEASSKVEVNDAFEKQIRELREAQDANSRAVAEGLQSVWIKPDLEGGPTPWNGDLFILENLSLPFSREELNEAFEEVLKDADSPGVSGDLIAATLQADYLGTMERAYRARHTMRRPRAMAHAAGRFYGHGGEKGVLTQTALEFVRGIVNQTKGQA